MAEKCLPSSNNVTEIKMKSKSRSYVFGSKADDAVLKHDEAPASLDGSVMEHSDSGPTEILECTQNSDTPKDHVIEFHSSRIIEKSDELGESARTRSHGNNIKIYLETPALDQADSAAVSEELNIDEPCSSDSVRGFLEEDTSSSCSNLLNLNSDESHSGNDDKTKEFQKSSIQSKNNCLEPTPAEPNNKSSSSTLYENDVQSMDAIERRDFENEQKLTGGVIIKAAAFNNGNQLNLEFVNKLGLNGKKRSLSENKNANVEKDLSATPTTSRCGGVRLTKSAAKLNLSATLDRAYAQKSEDGTETKSSKCLDKNSFTIANGQQRVEKQFELFMSSNSNDSLSSDKSCNTSSNHSLQKFFDKTTSNTEKNNCHGSDGNASSRICTTTNSYSDPVASTSSQPPKCQYSHFCCENSTRSMQKEVPNESSVSGDANVSSSVSTDTKKKLPVSTATSKALCTYDNTIQNSTSSTSSRSSRALENNFFEPLMQSSNISLRNDHTENDFDDETWADCEEGSDEEVCTCSNYSNEYADQCAEDELPSRDVDLSGYIQLVTISEEDVFLNDNVQSDSNNIHRKRKLIENRVTEVDSSFGETTPGGRKRIALETTVLRKNSSTPTSQTLGITSPTSSYERRTPRSLIPTKDNPPPELSDWLLQFQRWSHAERLLAVDRLIEHCEPTQVRHMMKVIEPQFQRDFISLLPKELALQVLSYLEPKDLLRAAQTCRSWRFLCDDNLLWKEKCKQAQIVIEPNTDRPKRGRAGNMPPISSPWKAAFMRQHIIEMNWRSRPIRQPKVLKGHDDHVITCLQFCGNRIVSGSDDNTLKVWSAVTGKCLRTLVGHTGGVWSSQMSGNIIISGSTDRTLKVWNVETGQCIHTLLGHTSTVRCMHLHGNKVVSGSRDATLRVWDIEQGTCLHVLVGHLAAVRCVQYDGKLIVSGAYDYMVKVWNPERQECLHTLQGHTNRVYSLQFDGVHVVSGSLDTSIRVWDVETGSCKHTLTGHQSLTSGMELRQNILVSGNADSTVKVWDITTGQCLQTLSGPNKHQSAVTCLQFNSKFVITSSDDGTVKLWDVKTGEFIRNLVALDSGGSGGVVWRIRANDTKLICAIGSRNGTEETKLMILDFDVEGACLKCS